jgi:hypothetical protein
MAANTKSKEDFFSSGSIVLKEVNTHSGHFKNKAYCLLETLKALVK